MNAPRISVIMSIFNEPEEWIRQSISSILAQSFRDFEFIIVNDNPLRKDNNLLLDDYRGRDSRIIVITNETNLGLTKSLNKALLMARGEMIARMDADDISVSNRLEKQIAFLKSHSSIVAVGAWVIPIDERGKQVQDVVRYERDPKWARAQLIQNSQICHPASMFRRIVNGSAVQYDESLKYAQDYSLWVSLLPYGDIANIPEPLLKFRTSRNQISNSKIEEQRECAERVQKSVFALYNLPSNEAFCMMFSALTIHHNMDISDKVVKNGFNSFFKCVSLRKHESLILEIVYCTYLAFLRSKSGGNFTMFLKESLENSSPFMILIGLRLCFHLLKRKLARVY